MYSMPLTSLTSPGFGWSLWLTTSPFSVLTGGLAVFLPKGRLQEARSTTRNKDQQLTHRAYVTHKVNEMSKGICSAPFFATAAGRGHGGGLKRFAKVIPVIGCPPFPRFHPRPSGAGTGGFRLSPAVRTPFAGLGIAHPPRPGRPLRAGSGLRQPRPARVRAPLSPSYAAHPSPPFVVPGETPRRRAQERLRLSNRDFILQNALSSTRPDIFRLWTICVPWLPVLRSGRFLPYVVPVELSGPSEHIPSEGCPGRKKRYLRMRNTTKQFTASMRTEAIFAR